MSKYLVLTSATDKASAGIFDAQESKCLSVFTIHHTLALKEASFIKMEIKLCVSLKERASYLPQK